MNVHVTESTYARNLRHCRRNDTPRQRARRGRMRCWAHFVATALFVCGLRCLEVACNLGRQPRLGHGSSVARAPPGTAFLAAPGAERKRDATERVRREHKATVSAGSGKDGWRGGPRATPLPRPGPTGHGPRAPRGPPAPRPPAAPLTCRG